MFILCLFSRPSYIGLIFSHLAHFKIKITYIFRLFFGLFKNSLKTGSFCPFFYMFFPFSQFFLRFPFLYQKASFPQPPLILICPKAPSLLHFLGPNIFLVYSFFIYSRNNLKI